MWVARFACIEVSPVAEKVPFNRAYAEGFSGLRVELGELITGISDENASKRLLNVLKIATCSEFREARRESTCAGSSDIIARSYSIIWIDFRSKDRNLISKFRKSVDVCNKLLGDGVEGELFSGPAVGCWASGLADRRESKSGVKQSMEVSMGSPVEGEESDAFEDDSVELGFESLDGFVGFIYNLLFPGLVYEDAAASHLEGWALKGAGEVVGRGADWIELGGHRGVAVVGDAYVEAVVDLIPFPLCKSFRVLLMRLNYPQFLAPS